MLFRNVRISQLCCSWDQVGCVGCVRRRRKFVMITQIIVVARPVGRSVWQSVRRTGSCPAFVRACECASVRRSVRSGRSLCITVATAATAATATTEQNVPLRAKASRTSRSSLSRHYRCIIDDDILPLFLPAFLSFCLSVCLSSFLSICLFFSRGGNPSFITNSRLRLSASGSLRKSAKMSDK